MRIYKSVVRKRASIEPDKPIPVRPPDPIVKTPTPAVKPVNGANGKKITKAASESHVKYEDNPVSTKRHKLIITIKDTGDSERDANCLRRVVFTIKEFPGHDEISLSIMNDGKRVRMKLANVQTGYNEELRQRLVELVGEEGLKVESAIEANS